MSTRVRTTDPAATLARHIAAQQGISLGQAQQLAARAITMAARGAANAAATDPAVGDDRELADANDADVKKLAAYLQRQEGLSPAEALKKAREQVAKARAKKNASTSAATPPKATASDRTIGVRELARKLSLEKGISLGDALIAAEVLINRRRRQVAAGR